MIRRLRVPEAASALGISQQAVRHRIRRGTLESEKDTDGTVWLLLEGVSADSPEVSADGPEDGPGNNPQDHALLDLVEVLREQLAAAEARERRGDERERELRRIIAGLVQRVPELPSADDPVDSFSEPPGEPVSHSDNGSSNVPPPEPEGRSWWRRLLEG